MVFYCPVPECRECVCCRCKCSEEYEDPAKCTTRVHVDIDSGKVLNPCIVCKVRHDDDPPNTYRIKVMGVDSIVCLLEEGGAAEFKFSPNMRFAMSDGEKKKYENITKDMWTLDLREKL